MVVETIKFLGLQMDNQITWKNHIQLFSENWVLPASSWGDYTIY
jgi:hypothetical protein